MRKGKILRRASVILGVVGLSFAFAAVAWADAPNPNSIAANAVRNADNTITVTIQGTWNWDRDDCGPEEDGRWAGWAADWNDANQPGVKMDGEDFFMGAAAGNALNPADNAVHTDETCDEGPVDSESTGSRGPLSHTYAADTTEITVCVIMYDIHVDEIGDTGVFEPDDPEQVIAAAGEGNNDYNDDNSIQNPNGDDPSVCIEADIPIPPPNPPPPGPPAPGPAVSPTLAFTGSSNGPLLATGLGMLALGGLAVFVAKRRHSTVHLDS
jgi:hypothetical protein